MKQQWIHRMAIGAAALLVCSLGAFAQAPPPPGDPGPHGPRHGGGPMEFGRFEMGLIGKTVAGAPYSAQIVTQHTQTLGDGTHVSVQSSGAVYRDSAGRVRREMSLPGLGMLTGSDSAPRAVFISDPVAGYHYVLHADSQSADRMPLPPAFNGKEHFRQRDNDQVVKESLGTQMIEGVQAEGTRITKTIPVGAIGNDKPIQIVTERWYSPDLQVVVLFKHSDPRFGESSMRLTNISRTQPAASLFAVPSNYTVNDMPPPPAFGRRGGAAPPKE
ncbi:MAG TPA: hypothetical protein VLW54_10795 [Candidatus Acidoferrales bacterium]|nr:hypothetical protein [Candidatus Acidoferrales bacterium]